MKQMIAAVCFMLAAAPLALAQDKSKDGDKKAAASEKSMKADAQPDKRMGQQDKMRACSKEAAERKMKGDERRGFMKECLAK